MTSCSNVSSSSSISKDGVGSDHSNTSGSNSTYKPSTVGCGGGDGDSGSRCPDKGWVSHLAHTGTLIGCDFVVTRGKNNCQTTAELLFVL